MSESGKERNGRGAFDCPIPSCADAIVGSYSDLLGHVLDEHPLATTISQDGKPLTDRIKDARSEALRRDIQEHMVVSGDCAGTTPPGESGGERDV